MQYDMWIMLFRTEPMYGNVSMEYSGLETWITLGAMQLGTLDVYLFETE